MSATQLAAWIVACAVAGTLAILAVRLVWAARRGEHARFGVAALATGLLALAVLGMGLAVASPRTGVEHDGRCGPGLYDNGGASSNGPVCIPWKGQMP